MDSSSWVKFQGSMQGAADSGGTSAFESLSLSPGPATSNFKADEVVSSASSQPSPVALSETSRPFSFTNKHASPLPSSPLGGVPRNLGAVDLGRSLQCKVPAPISIGDREIRTDPSNGSPYRQAAEKQTCMPSPISKEYSSFTRLPSMKGLSRNMSIKDRAAQHTLTRLLSMEKGESWNWSPETDDMRRDELLFGNDGASTDLYTELYENTTKERGFSATLRRISKLGNRPTKRLLALIVLNFSYSATELLIGLYTGRIGLISDAFHLTFGCGVLTFSLFAMVLAQRRPDEVYSYGYKRLEVLAAFTNSLFLLFLSFSLAVEALHAYVQDESEHKHYLIISAVANLMVNLLGVWFFRSYARVRVVYRKAEDMNNHSICLHVLSDSIRSAGVILASWLLMLGITNAETLCLGLVAVAVFFTTLPLFKASCGVLSQMTPPGISTSALNKCLRQVLLHQDILDCHEARFWDMVPGAVVGTLILKAKTSANEQIILRHVHSVYNDIGVKDLTVQIELANDHN